MRKKNPLEKVAQKAILDYLKYRGFVAFKHLNIGIKKPNGSYIPLPAGDKGISDIIVCSPSGKFIAIEVKREGEDASPVQKDFLKRVNDNGGYGFVARSIDDVIENFGKIIKKEGRI